MTQLKVNLIGAGRVGQTFLRLLSANPNCVIQDVMSTNYQSALNAVEFAGAGHAVKEVSELRPADLWLLSVPDSQISAVANSLAEVLGSDGPQAKAPVAVHFSGFFAAYEMAPLGALGWRLASVHPVLSFSDPETALKRFSGTYCGLEGDDAALALVDPLLVRMGARTFPIRSEHKSLYHAAAVISNNFTVVLQAIAREAWAAAGVPDEIARELNTSLLRATYENVTALGPRDALTGPAARGDAYVVDRQGEDVADWHAAAGVLYREMSALAHRLKAEGKTLADTEPES
ncbi:Rossmann-like and DUF2520 domain-containing protein [Ruegeria marisrubri]|uniref:Rossmann-like and DUF2520 domain-containing protein n=1 Tax=Ruegeria marisrubri TaxID=1685379 RepID=UPI000B124171|nr:Rossmann-like and DUF2520 domain-containing protein [Ruegeria marisrubri]